MVRNPLRSTAPNRNDDISTTAQDDQADVDMAVEEAGGELFSKELDVSARERRLDEKEREVQKRERDVSSQQSRMTEERHKWEVQTHGLSIEYDQQLRRKEGEKIAAEKWAKDAVDKLKQESGEWEKQFQRDRHHRLTLEGKIQHQQKEIQNLQDVTKRMEIQHSETRELLEARRLELASAQSFLTTADSLSGADASGMVEGLNDAIFQVAASMAEAFEFRDSKADREDRKIACDWVEKDLGLTMLELLRSVRHCEDQLVVQIALQACMTKLLGRAIPRWHLDSSKGQNLLVNIHSCMREEGGSLSSQEHGCSHAYARKALQSQSDISSLQSSIVDVLSDVLVTAGCTVDRPIIQEKLQSKFIRGISAIIRSATRLHKALGEDITSGNLEVICIPSGDTFDPATMEDNDGQSKAQKGKDGRVLCTTGLRKSKVTLESVTEGMAMYDSKKMTQ